MIFLFWTQESALDYLQLKSQVSEKDIFSLKMFNYEATVERTLRPAKTFGEIISLLIVFQISSFLIFTFVKVLTVNLIGVCLYIVTGLGGIFIGHLKFIDEIIRGKKFQPELNRVLNNLMEKMSEKFNELFWGFGKRLT